MSLSGGGEWFADSDGQWTWRQPDGSCWRQGADGAWRQLAIEAAPAPSAKDSASSTSDLSIGQVPQHQLVGPHFGFQQFAAEAPAPSSGSSGDHVGVAAPTLQSPVLPPPHFESTAAVQVQQEFHGTLPGALSSPPHPGPPPSGVAVQDHSAHPYSFHEEPHSSAPQKPETSAMAVWSLVLALIPGPVFLYLGSLLSVVLGLEARHHIKHSHGSLRGKTPAVLAVLLGLAWLATIPIVVSLAISNFTSLYHAFFKTAEDTAAKTAVSHALTDGADNIYKVKNSYAGISASAMPNIPLVHFSDSCTNGSICLASGSSASYSWIQMCEQTSAGHAWIVSQTSGQSPWYGEEPGACPAMGDPGSAAGQPAQSASWRQGSFPPPTLDVTLFGHHYHWTLP